ncbi:hypothetical protein RHGRI_010861 [Rhododendron griersonianum]|uniref:Uncharacterized protein n=1 Tax=Rhododendron griersonianum TaxID=479676 RepID=A0AAV6HV18_9ERIC|nr:hypothetical protein RHGRI_037575 [Rhododendron griersonianum]KAG5528978.1 hypothetical protein RHGRI_029590 [Rhododendron griersonianum]KAG5552894.1 hypothetical protein RHGRI_010861 [Rhododendron griersonianum]
MAELMAEQARQKHEGGRIDVAYGSQPGKEMSFKPSSNSAKNAKDIEGGEKRVLSLMVVLGIPKCFLVLLARYTWVVGGFG